MFTEVPSSFDFPRIEKETLAFWEANRIYEKSLKQREGRKPFVFFEGPPTANGLPHPGHCLTRAIKDLFPRYKTMTGHHCLRKGGWDTHGLPVEVEVCKELGIHTKEEIEEYGVEKFNKKCLESVFRYTKEWEDLTRRLGFWVNLDEAYVTYHRSYIESVWWALKTLFDAGVLYQGHKIVWWWAQGGTALSAGEVGQGYREVDDPSVYVRFPLVHDNRFNAVFSPSAPGSAGGPAQKNLSLLVWTTTPWTLPSNMFAAVHKDFDYAIVLDEETGERLIFAEALVEPIAKKVKKVGKWKVERTVKGTDLVGLRYQPPFPECYYARRAVYKLVSAEIRLKTLWADLTAPVQATYDGAATPSHPVTEHVCFRVVPASFVTLESGTGLVHEAPAFGEVDFDLWRGDLLRYTQGFSYDIFCSVAPNGQFTNEGPEFCRGRWVKDCDKDIIRDLKERGLLLHQETYRHDYPFCWRAEEDPLIQYPRKSWFIRTTQFKDAMLENNRHINWLPEHIKTGRFGKFLESNVDWSLSRERYWGTPLPIWVCQSCGHAEAIDSYDALVAKPGIAGLEVWEDAKRAEPNLSDHLKVHKPYIDAVTYDCPKCAGGGGTAARAEARGSSGGRMTRVPEVIDCWFDSGAMPFAQWGWPHRGDEMMRAQFPADFISEALDQTRGWFYSLTAIAVMLFGKVGVLHNGGMGVSPATAPGSVGVSPAEIAGGVLSMPVGEGLATRRRWKLPHWESGGSTYLLTIRVQTGELSTDERTLVLDACRHWDQQRMCLHAAVVMPDHVHLLCTPLKRNADAWWSVADLLHSVKSLTSHELNKRRGSAGSIWQREYYDRIIPGSSDFEEKWRYVVENPKRQGLGEEYAWVWVENPDAPTEALTERYVHDSDSAGETPTLPNGGRYAHTPLMNIGSDYPLPFRNCIVLGLLMGEDGLKMSKQKKNYKEPSYIFEHEGADAMRWLFFSGQAPWTSIRFQESAIADGQREFLIRLYNCYSFFVIYANIDGWTPDQSRDPDDQSRDRKGAVTIQSGGPSNLKQNPSLTVGALNELDRWILSELAACSVKVHDAMEAYDNYSAAGALIEFVDALSNWYVRRSRERFWRSGMDDDKRAAYQTLYDCLVTTAKLIAPFTPFFAESMYQNLVVDAVKSQSHDPSRDAIEQSRESLPAVAGMGAVTAQPSGPSDSLGDPSLTVGALAESIVPESVHLCDYPVTAETRGDVERRIDLALNEEINLVRQLVSCGRAARAATKLRVRQPLAKLEVFHRRADLLRKHADLVRDELNVKRIDFVASADIDQFVHYEVKPDFKKIGPKFGPLAPKIKAALAKHPNVDAIVRQLEQTGSYTLTVEGQVAELSAEELHVELHAREGWSAERIPGQGILVFDTHLTEELRDEGLARDLVNQIQQQRKSLSLRYEQHIDLAVVGDELVGRVVNQFAAYIQGETLAKHLLSKPITGANPTTTELEGHAAEIYVRPLG